MLVFLQNMPLYILLIKLRAVHATSQAASTYCGILADSDLEIRLAALEKQLEE